MSYRGVGRKTWVGLSAALALGCASGAQTQETITSFGTAPSGGTGGTATSDETGGGSATQGGNDSATSTSGPDDSGGGNDDADCTDMDGDDYGDGCNAGTDCDDDDPDINPGVAEACDGVDQNCDDEIDNGCECPDDGISANCNTPTDLGVVEQGQMVLGIVANVPQEDALDWYTVSFPAPARPGLGTPTINFAINEDEAFVFDIVSGPCEAAGLACQSGGTMGAAIALTDWSFVDNDPGCCTAPNDAMVAWPAQLWLRVYRTSAGASCAAYQLQVSRP
jgi:hypothetical protein